MTKTLEVLVEHGSPEELEQVLAAREIPSAELDAALHLAARLGHVPAIRVLASAGASVEAKTEQAGWRPLHTAVEHEQIDAIRELVVLGADINSKADEGVTPLHLAVDATVDAVEQVGTTSGLAAVRLLLELGADPGVQDASGSTARDWAKEAGLAELSALLA